MFCLRNTSRSRHFRAAQCPKEQITTRFPNGLAARKLWNSNKPPNCKFFRIYMSHMLCKQVVVLMLLLWPFLWLHSFKIQLPRPSLLFLDPVWPHCWHGLGKDTVPCFPRHFYYSSRRHSSPKWKFHQKTDQYASNGHLSPDCRHKSHTFIVHLNNKQWKKSDNMKAWGNSQCCFSSESITQTSISWI